MASFQSGGEQEVCISAGIRASSESAELSPPSTFSLAPCADALIARTGKASTGLRNPESRYMDDDDVAFWFFTSSSFTTC